MADREELEAEAEERLGELTSAEPVPHEQLVREGNEERREAFQKWERDLTAEDGE